MICPICGKYGFESEKSVSKHIWAVFDVPHTNWLDSHGFKPATKLLGKGGINKLADYLTEYYKTRK
jgi:hypothetical protein